MNDKDTRTTVVCLHGSAGTSGMWRDLIAAVRGRCDVITPDVHACDLLSELARLDEPFHLVGHGYGGELALEFAARMAERLPGATLLKLVGLRHMAPHTHSQLVSSVILDYILPVAMPERARAA